MLVLIVAMSVTVGYMSMLNAVRDLAEPQTRTTLLAREALEAFFTRHTDSLKSLATDESWVLEALERGDVVNPSIRAAFASVLTRQPDVDQVRWLSEAGRELLRVNRDPATGGARFASQSMLQDKALRPYFRQGLSLRPGQILVMPLDLNVESEIIQVPHVPTMRLLMRVQDASGAPRGLFIINVAAQKFLSHLNDLALPGVNFHLINEQGYWFKNPANAGVFGFMFDNDRTFAVAHPEVWHELRDSGMGQEVLEGGLWTWISLKVGGARPEVLGGETWYWIAQIPPETVRAVRLAALLRGGGITAVVSVLFLILVWRLNVTTERLLESREAIERQAGQLDELRVELGKLQRGVSHVSALPVGESMYSGHPLEQVSPDTYTELKKRYVRILEDALESLVLHDDQEIATRLREMADELGELNAGPRDLVDLHRGALEELGQALQAQKLRALMQEARWVLLELTGRLALYYRRYSVGRHSHDNR